MKKALARGVALLGVKVTGIKPPRLTFVKVYRRPIRLPDQSSAGLELPTFEVGDYVLYARVRRPGVTPKLMATWTGPWRVVGAHHPHLFEIQNIVSGRVHTAHVARLRFYADSQLNVTADVKNVFQHAFNQGQFQMAGVVRVAEADDRSLIVLVDWVGF